MVFDSMRSFFPGNLFGSCAPEAFGETPKDSTQDDGNGLEYGPTGLQRLCGAHLSFNDSVTSRKPGVVFVRLTKDLVLGVCDL